MIVGGFLFAFIDLFGGLWIILIGWFISTSAQSQYRQTLIQRDIGNLKARDMMSRAVDRVTPEMNLAELYSYFLQYKHNIFPVMRGDQLFGSVSSRGLRKVKKERYDSMRVSDIMTPREKLATVKVDNSAKDVLALMGNNRIEMLFVLSNDPEEGVVGVITRADLIRMIQTQEALSRSGAKEPPPGSERTITVEEGMLFQIQSPLVEGGSMGWVPQYDPSQFALVAQHMAQLSSDHQLEEFTLQALRKGTFYIALNRQGESTKNAIKYTIIVN